MARQVTIADARAAAEQDLRALRAALREPGISKSEKERIAGAILELTEQLDLLDD